MNVNTTFKKTIPLHDCTEARKAAVKDRLRAVGADSFDLILPESRNLPFLLAPDEKLLGAVYGKYTQDKGSHVSRGMLAITDRRIILIDKKPLFMRFNDINFDVVSGVTYAQSGLGEAVTLNTRMGDISLRTFNQVCANRFVKSVEDMLFNNPTRDALGDD